MCIDSSECLFLAMNLERVFWPSSRTVWLDKYSLSKLALPIFSSYIVPSLQSGSISENLVCDF